MFNPLLFLRNNTSKELSLFAESAAAVNRVVLQHMSINVGMWEVEGEAVSLETEAKELVIRTKKARMHKERTAKRRRSGHGQDLRKKMTRIKRQRRRRRRRIRITFLPIKSS